MGSKGAHGFPADSNLLSELTKGDIVEVPNGVAQSDNDGDETKKIGFVTLSDVAAHYLTPEHSFRRGYVEGWKAALEEVDNNSTFVLSGEMNLSDIIAIMRRHLEEALRDWLHAAKPNCGSVPPPECRWLPWWVDRETYEKEIL